MMSAPQPPEGLALRDHDHRGKQDLNSGLAAQRYKAALTKTPSDRLCSERRAPLRSWDHSPHSWLLLTAHFQPRPLCLHHLLRVCVLEAGVCSQQGWCTAPRQDAPGKGCGANRPGLGHRFSLQRASSALP